MVVPDFITAVQILQFCRALTMVKPNDRTFWFGLYRGLIF